MDPPRALDRRGFLASLGIGRGRVRLELEAGTIGRGRTRLPLKSLRLMEYRRGFLTVGTGEDWLTIDLDDYRDDAGPLLDKGALSPSAVRLVELLKQTVEENGKASPPSEALAPCRLELSYRVRIDRLAIVLTVVTIVIFLADLYSQTDRLLLSWQGFAWFSLLCALGFSVLVVKRKTSGLRFDAEGVTRRTLLRSTLYPWTDLQEYRRQHGEVELVGDKVRVPLTLPILAAGGSPLILIRGREAFLGAPGRILLQWIGERMPERGEPPVEHSAEHKRTSRWWMGGVVAAHAAIFFASNPFSGDRLPDRLAALGARTGNWMREPWQLLTSLLLHGSLSHLFINMLMLTVLGPWVGRLYGWGRAWALYLGSGILGNLIGELLRPPGAPPAVGASTAILGFLGVLFHAAYRNPYSLPLAVRARFRWAIPATLLLTLGLGLAIPVLDNGAHLGGFLAGVVLAGLTRPSSSSPSPPPPN